METVEGTVMFRNQMGDTSLIKIETADKSIRTLCFHRPLLGERYDEAKAIPLFAVIRADVEPSTRAWRIPDVVNVVSFAKL